MFFYVRAYTTTCSLNSVSTWKFVKEGYSSAFHIGVCFYEKHRPTNGQFQLLPCSGILQNMKTWRPFCRMEVGPVLEGSQALLFNTECQAKNLIHNYICKYCNNYVVSILLFATFCLMQNITFILKKIIISSKTKQNSFN